MDSKSACHEFEPSTAETRRVRGRCTLVCRELKRSPVGVEVGRRVVLLARGIVRSVLLEIDESSGHEKVPTRRKPGLERRGRPRGERIEGSHLAEANLKSKRPFLALPLTPEHRQLRLQWCQARSMWDVTDWQKVVFSDESRFVLGTDDNRVTGVEAPW
ncbi:hypothetical protein TNCV_4795301 [Trichonephila clavipes]|nr:hypothetical protein TNCV_4795301 [Trichonephila clavipes]